MEGRVWGVPRAALEDEKKYSQVTIKFLWRGSQSHISHYRRLPRPGPVTNLEDRRRAFRLAMAPAPLPFEEGWRCVEGRARSRAGRIGRSGRLAFAHHLLVALLVALAGCEQPAPAEPAADRPRRTEKVKGSGSGDMRRNP